MILNNVKIDFQFTGWSVEKEKPATFGILSRAVIKKAENFRKNLISIVKHAYSDEENRAVCFLNYYQPKYERVTNDEELFALEERGFEINDSYKHTFIGVTGNKGKNWLYIIKGREYLCREGHLIAACSERSLENKQRWYECAGGPNIEEILKFEKSQGSILIASHPLPKFGLLTKIALFSLRDPSGMNFGLQENTIKKHMLDFDALEAYSLSMIPNQTRRVEELAGELKLPTVSNTDSNLFSSFRAYNLFDWVDFSNPEMFRESVRKGLRRSENNYLEKRSVFSDGLRDNIFHILLGLIQKREYF